MVVVVEEMKRNLEGERVRSMAMDWVLEIRGKGVRQDSQGA